MRQRNALPWWGGQHSRRDSRPVWLCAACTIPVLTFPFLIT